MDVFFARIDRALFRVSVAVLSLLFLFAASMNTDWSPLGILKLVWGLGVTFVIFGAISMFIGWVLTRLFR